MKVGDRVVRKSTLESGYIYTAKKLPSGCYMVAVLWDGKESTQWLPSEEVRPWDKMPPPLPGPEPTRRKFFKRPLSNARRKEMEAQKLADKLVGLSGKRKNRSKSKAEKLIAKFNGAGTRMTKPAWNYAPTEAEMERRSMKKLYQEKSRDHSY